jgi:hypothetical protein
MGHVPRLCWITRGQNSGKTEFSQRNCQILVDPHDDLRSTASIQVPVAYKVLTSSSGFTSLIKDTWVKTIIYIVHFLFAGHRPPAHRPPARPPARRPTAHRPGHRLPAWTRQVSVRSAAIGPAYNPTTPAEPPRSLYTEELLHIDALTYKSFFIEKSLPTHALT